MAMEADELCAINCGIIDSLLATDCIGFVRVVLYRHTYISIFTKAYITCHSQFKNCGMHIESYLHYESREQSTSYTQSLLREAHEAKHYKTLSAIPCRACFCPQPYSKVSV